MSSATEVQKADASRIELNDSLSPVAIEQQRFTNDSTPKSTQSSESDDNVNNEIAAQGFERFRKKSTASFFLPDNNNNDQKDSGFFSRNNSINSSSTTSSSASATTAVAAFSPPPSDTIAEYCNESLYSYSFTPLSRVKRAAKIKKQILNRGMDYMQRFRHRDNIGRRFSQPDMGVLDQQQQQWMAAADERLKAYPSMIDMASVNNLNNGNKNGNMLSPPPSAPPMTTPPSLPLSANHQSHYSTVANGSAYAAETPLSPVTTKEPSSLEEKEDNGATTTVEAPVDEDGFSLGRRQTIEVFNNLRPIYEKRLLPSTLTHNRSNKGAASISPQYTRALHAPSRFLPQNQAILTTDTDGTILLFNDMASLCFSIDKSYIGKKILTAIEEPFQTQISGILRRRKSLASSPNTQQAAAAARENRLQEKGLVLVCGVVVPIRKMNHSNGTTGGEEKTSNTAASLWLKEKMTDEGKSIYIWIFEEIYETSLTAHLDAKGTVTKVVGATKELFGYEPDQVIDKPITLLIPALSNGNISQPGVNLEKIDKVKFFSGRSKLGACFPTMVTSSSSSTTILKIVSLPSIAGLITIHSNTGKIQSINPVPAKYLFGYSTETLVEKFDIDQIIPQFSDVVNGLRQCNLLQYSSTVNNHACRWAISDMCSAERYKSMEVGQSLKSLERTPSINANGGQALPVIYAVHRDGSQFEIQVQLRLIESEEENLISIWVTYDRIHALKRSKRLTAADASSKKATSTTTATTTQTKSIPTTNLALNDQQQQQQQTSHHPLSLSVSTHTLSSLSVDSAASSKNAISQELQKQDDQENEGEQEKEEEDEKPLTMKKRPSIRPYGFSSFGGSSLEGHKKGMFPPSMLTKHDEMDEEESSSASSSSTASIEQVNDLEVKEKKAEHPIDAYAVIGTLGEGAYGTAKLAYRKDDVNKTKVVIKSIAKSRIIVDSWIRDRSCGLLTPLEIHILQKLKQHPQLNCCCLETYMEDDDTYFVVMKLHGKSSMDLFDYIELNEHISEQQVLDIFKQVCLAVQHIHNLGIVHRDIKDENILLDDEGTVQLIDFGSAAYYKKDKTTFDTFGGTLDYCAPEILKGSKYEGPPQDIWSLGTLLYTLIYRENPFYNLDEIMEHDLRIPFVLSEGSIDLIKKMLNRDVDQRYNINQMLDHPWLKQQQQ